LYPEDNEQQMVTEKKNMITREHFEEAMKYKIQLSFTFLFHF